MTTVKMFMVVGDQNSDALAAKVAEIPNCRTELYTCPQTIQNIQPMPFIQVNGEERFYGREGIKTFLKQKGLSASLED